MMIFRLLLGLVLIFLTARVASAGANPYLAKPGEPVVPIRVATCAISGGFIHLHTALDHGLFDKYGLRPEFLLVRGAGVSAAALTSNEIQFLYCTADAIIPSLAAGAEGKMIASPLIGLPWVIIARKDVKKVEQLKGKIFLVTRPGGTPDTLIRALLKKLNLTTEDVGIRHIGGAGQTEVYNALLQGQLRDNELAFAASELEPFVLDASVGVTKRLRRLQLGYAVRYQSREIRAGLGARAVVWAGFTITSPLERSE